MHRKMTLQEDMKKSLQEEVLTGRRNHRNLTSLEEEIEGLTGSLPS